MKLSFLSKKKGMSALSDELERPLMEILWANGPRKGREIYEEIRLEKNIAYTTALTVLDRLAKKGFIKKDGQSGVILFSPRISREAYTGAITENLVQQAFTVSPDMAVSAFADHFSKMSESDRAKLEGLLLEKRNGRRG
jgi:predicted transcriptional regulator